MIRIRKRMSNTPQVLNSHGRPDIGPASFFAHGEIVSQSLVSDQSPVMNANNEQARLLALLRGLLSEVFPGQKVIVSVNLDSRLDRDLGLDSLARVELFSRIEGEFGCTLGETVLAEAETLGDLLQAIRGRKDVSPSRGTAGVSAVGHRAAGDLLRLPDGANTLIEVLAWHAEHHGERTHIRLLGEGGEVEVSYRRLYESARRVAAGLIHLGFQPGETAAIMLPTGTEYFFSFFGILLAGGVPVPIYPPVRPNQLEDHLRRHRTILDNCQAVVLLTIAKAMPVARLFKAQVISLRHAVCVDSLWDAEEVAGLPGNTRCAKDLAFLQYTSGSTGTPKGVVLSHANLLANIRAMGRVVGVTPDDVFVSWLPLYHDMGLIGAWLGSLYHAMPLVVMSPLRFLAQPSRWLDAIHQHRGTLSAAPNFAYALCTKRITDDAMRHWDLSCWRWAFNGAEPVQPDTLSEFARRFQPAGVRSHILTPVFGLAECSVGLAFPPAERGPRVDVLDRKVFAEQGRASVAKSAGVHPLRFVSGGQPLPDHEVRICDDSGHELPDRREGRLQFKGPSACDGYYRNPQATAELFDGEWLDSGDLGYISEGEVFITGRRKDLIIVGGRNLYPHDLEEVVGALEGIRQGCVAVFGIRRDSGTEGFVVVAETRETAQDRKEHLRQRIVETSVDQLEMPPDQVLLAPPQSVLKTSSGKIRRQACREAYENKRLGQAPAAVWRQVLRLVATAWRPLSKRARTGLSHWGFAVFSWVVLVLLAVPTWVLVVTVPGLRARQRIARGSARLLVFLTRAGVGQLPADRFPSGGCVVVANHASYLDGAILLAALPEGFVFVAKGELAGQWVAGPFLRGLGTLFVDRTGGQRARSDARGLVDRAGRDRRLVFFPEGTFTRAPGLRAFRLGAFQTAVKARLPVVPVMIKGSRSKLRAGTWLPRPGVVDVTAAKAQSALTDDAGFREVVDLRDRVRAVILVGCGEPDLGFEHAMPPEVHQSSRP